MDKYINLATQWGIKILGAIVIYIIGKWLAKIVTNIIKKLLEKTNTDVTLIKFLGNLTYVGLLILVILAALGTLGVDTSSFAAIIAGAGLAVGMALKDNISNFGAGVLILMLRPFKVGDFVEIAGTSGTVDEIGIFNTTLKTGDNRVIIIPNNNIIGNNIINYSKEKIRRIDLVIGVGYEDDLKLVKSTLEEILNNHPKILKEPAPTVALAELADSSINFNVRPWVKSEDYWNVRSELLEKIKETFDKKNINIPYPQMDVHVDQKAA
ncbi:small conductance mechanosensitive channel [Lebetimonas natsushimae]|uniref:Small conductance mechanosensitive channel n=1 Tax=Lebetimonas natsushimae TaxID=1936991 RepID=A0A292YB23_9BACT|nr:mechanosensitive ion channel domain-containing protein [Lebetimonas natsushimae]GAX86716.1 small conductance mechanosensitive channel [Lebetimonas natsushimae]